MSNSYVGFTFVPHRETFKGYQECVGGWMGRMPNEVMRWSDADERVLRFLEEALELVQAEGLSKERALRVLDYVFGRPVGEKAQEVGGVAVTLAAYCRVAHIDLQEAALTELERINSEEVMQKIANKQAAKRAAGMTSDTIGDGT